MSISHCYNVNVRRNFIPDSGKLLHLKTPLVNEDVRVDAGFVQGDEISSHYDPMIAKLIVRGHDRTSALQKMSSALGAYEIAGPITNIEFLKRICKSPGFIAGEVETGYIENHREELFSQQPIANEVWIQTALGTLLQHVSGQASSNSLLLGGTALGFGHGYQSRTFHLSRAAVGNAESAESVAVRINQLSADTYDVSVGDAVYPSVTARLTSPTTIETFLPHSRISSTIIRSPEDNLINIFQQGRQYRLVQVVPKWAEKALGIKDVTNSVVAPMPCKILRVDVVEGDQVSKDQSLVVIESMKMETVIRSPQNGTVKKVIHQKGDICKAGTVLVEFEEQDA